MGITISLMHVCLHQPHPRLKYPMWGGTSPELVTAVLGGPYIWGKKKEKKGGGDVKKRGGNIKPSKVCTKKTP